MTQSDSGRYFAEAANSRDGLRASFFSEAVREAALELADIRPGQPEENAGLTAVDLGAGAGFLTEALLEAGVTVFAVDASPRMLSRLAAKFPEACARARLTVLPGSAERLPLPDASVDRVLANMLLHHAEDPARAIREMARILRPGGKLVITDLDRHTHQFLLTGHHHRWPGFDRADVASWLAAAGLADARIDCAGQKCCAEAMTGGDSACVNIFAAHGARPLCSKDIEDADPGDVGARSRSFFEQGDESGGPLLCAESVLRGVAEALGAYTPPFTALIPRLASGLCSGVARTCGVCGAYSGGLLALGLALGRDHGRDSLDPVYAAAQEFTDWFEQTRPSTNCHALTGCDFRTPEGQKRFREGGVKHSVCLPLVEAAAAQVVRILQEQ